VHIPVPRRGAIGTIEFDWRAVRDILGRGTRGPVLTLGYNTALFCARLRLSRVLNIINMDGIEWRRDKWGPHEKAWLWLNERAGCWLGDHLVADHPDIARHLATRVNRAKISMIPYGAERIVDADPELLRPYGLKPRGFALLVARPEPENSILEVIKAFSRRHRGKSLVVLGNYQPSTNAYHSAVMRAASGEVLFPGAIYDHQIVDALRFQACLYVHGHTVGGTNPSLVEALGAGSAVLAHDNPFNRWVAGPGACYFRDEDECASRFDELLAADATLEPMRQASRLRHSEEFTWAQVLPAYEALLTRWATVKSE
jgi:glycosyltransferase involved in cell wall biosynthesis